MLYKRCQEIMRLGEQYPEVSLIGREEQLKYTKIDHKVNNCHH